MFNYVVDTSVEFTRKNGKFPCPGDGPYVVNHMIKIIECYLKPYRPNLAEVDEDDEEPESKVPADIEDKLSNILLYAMIWGIGACLDEHTRPNYDLFLQDLMNGEDVITKSNLDIPVAYEPMKLQTKCADFKSLFDMYFDCDEMKWTHWLNTQPKYTVDRDNTYL